MLHPLAHLWCGQVQRHRHQLYAARLGRRRLSDLPHHRAPAGLHTCLHALSLPRHQRVRAMLHPDPLRLQRALHAIVLGCFPAEPTSVCWAWRLNLDYLFRPRHGPCSTRDHVMHGTQVVGLSILRNVSQSRTPRHSRVTHLVRSRFLAAHAVPPLQL